MHGRSPSMLTPLSLIMQTYCSYKKSDIFNKLRDHIFEQLRFLVPFTNCLVVIHISVFQMRTNLFYLQLFSMYIFLNIDVPK